MENYLKILEESLQKKIQLLDVIQAYNEEQYQAFSSDVVDMNKFDEAIDKKGELIEQVLKLDEGFETLYANVASMLKENRAQYALQIARLQQLVQQVTNKSMSVQAQEARNKSLIESYFAKEKKQIGEGRRNSKVAYGYYKSLDKAVAEARSGFDLKK